MRFSLGVGWLPLSVILSPCLGTHVTEVIPVFSSAYVADLTTFEYQ
jgi:hypothetical protein